MNIGDYVIATCNIDGRIHTGDAGVIRTISRSGRYVGVEWDKDVHGHDIDGKCRNGHGWCVSIGYVALYNSDNDDANSLDIGSLL